MKVRHHHLKRSLVIAAAILGSAVPATSAAGEPKNDVPFIAATSTRPVAGEHVDARVFVGGEVGLHARHEEGRDSEQHERQKRERSG